MKINIPEERKIELRSLAEYEAHKMPLPSWSFDIDFSSIEISDKENKEIESESPVTPPQTWEEQAFFFETVAEERKRLFEKLRQMYCAVKSQIVRNKPTVNRNEMAFQLHVEYELQQGDNNNPSHNQIILKHKRKYNKNMSARNMERIWKGRYPDDWK